MASAIDLVVMGVAAVLGIAGVILLVREVIGDRGRRRRVPALRCPGGWSRRAFILPARIGCWYDLTATPPAADGRRQCPECGRRPRARRMRATRRSVVVAGLGLVMMGLAAVLLEGRAIQRSGVAAMPSWVLATLPFDERTWLDRQPVRSGVAFHDDAAAELGRRNSLGLLRGIAADHMARRVRRAMRESQMLMEEEQNAAMVARLRGARVRAGVEYRDVSSAAMAIAAETGVAVEIPDVDIDPTWGGDRQLTRTMHAPATQTPLRTLRAGLPAWEISGEQALDLLCLRAGRQGLSWRAMPAGVVLEAATGTGFTGFHDASAAARMPEAQPAEMALAVQDYALVYPYVRSQAASRGLTMPPGMTYNPYRDRGVEMIAPVLPPAAARRLLTTRWWVQERWAFLVHPARGESNSGFYRMGYGLTPNTPVQAVGQHLILDATLAEHRRLSQVLDAIAGTPAPPPPDRGAILATLARLDSPGEIAASPDLSATDGLRLIAEARGVEVVIDPVLLQHDEPGRAHQRLVSDLLRWRAHARRAWIAGAGRALVTDHASRDLLTEPRMYRLRIPADRVVDVRDPRPDALDPVDVARAALRLAAPIDMLWHDEPRGGVVRFVARTAPDEHALLTWTLEQIERSLDTGRHSPPSAAEGRPVVVYNITARATRENVLDGWTFDQMLVGESASLLRRTAIGSHVEGARLASWHQRSGCVFMVRLSPEDHARFGAALQDRAEPN